MNELSLSNLRGSCRRTLPEREFLVDHHDNGPRFYFACVIEAVLLFFSLRSERNVVHEMSRSLCLGAIEFDGVTLHDDAREDAQMGTSPRSQTVASTVSIES